MRIGRLYFYDVFPHHWVLWYSGEDDDSRDAIGYLVPNHPGGWARSIPLREPLAYAPTIEPVSCQQAILELLGAPPILGRRDP